MDFQLGCNYWASHAGIYMWRNWDKQVVEQYMRSGWPKTMQCRRTGQGDGSVVSCRVGACSRRNTFPRGEGGRAQRARMRNAGEQLKVCTGLELSGFARIPHPPLRGTLSPEEGIASYILHALNNNLSC